MPDNDRVSKVIPMARERRKKKREGVTKRLDMSEHERRLAQLDTPARLSGVMNIVVGVLIAAMLALVIWEMSKYF